MTAHSRSALCETCGGTCVYQGAEQVMTEQQRKQLEALVKAWRGTAKSCERIGGIQEGSVLHTCATELECLIEKFEMCQCGHDRNAHFNNLSMCAGVGCGCKGFHQ